MLVSHPFKFAAPSSRPLALPLAIALLVLLGLIAPAFGQVTVDPIGIATRLGVDESASKTVTLSNGGGEAVNWQVLLAEMHGGGRRDASGGPDDAGYLWRDNDEANGPAYSWINIEDKDGVVDVSPLYDDSLCGDQGYGLGFKFPYWGTDYDSVYIWANGQAALLPDKDIHFFYIWEPLPTANGNPPPSKTVMCVAWQDLNPAVAGHIYYWTDDAMAVVTWQDVPHFYDPGADSALWTFQLVLYANGMVKFQYHDIGMYKAQVNQTIMVGLQNEARDHGFTMVNDDLDYLEEGRCIGIGPKGSWIQWVSFEPTNGTIDAGGNTEVTATFKSVGLQDSAYTADAIFAFEGVGSVTVPLVLSVNSAVGNIAGTITDAAQEGVTVESARIWTDPYAFVRFSDADGKYSIEDLPAGQYHLYASADNFRDMDFGDVEVRDGETADGSMGFLHAECTPDRDHVDATLDSADVQDSNISITNGGNTDLHYTVSKRLPGGADADPWTLRASLPVGQTCSDARIQGVVFANGKFYVAGGTPADKPDSVNNIYVLNQDGELLDIFQQPVYTRLGIQDLDYDGNLLWGCASGIVYGIDPQDGHEVTHFSGPQNSNCSTIACGDGLIWVSGLTTNHIVAYDENGNQVKDVGQKGLKIYGLAYWPEDPDDCQLYTFDAPNPSDQAVHRINIDTGDTVGVALLAPEGGGSPVGAFITKQYDIYSWVFMDIANAGADDRIDIWQLAGNSSWFKIDPVQGQIAGGESQDFTLTLNANDLVANVEYQGELVWTHDGRGGETSVPITLDVVSAPVLWPFNLLQPADGDTIRADGVTFVWEASLDGATYTLQLQAGEDSVSYASDTTTLTLGLDTIGLNLRQELPNGVTWWVLARLEGDSLASNQRFHFFVPPPLFNLLQPADGDTIRTDTVAFLWEPLEVEGVRYLLYLQAGDYVASFATDTTALTLSLDTLGLNLNRELDNGLTWGVLAIVDQDTLGCFKIFSFVIPALSAAVPPELPKEFALRAAYPNPFNSATTIKYEMPVAGVVSLAIYDLAGRQVALLSDGNIAAGYHRAVWSAAAEPAGLYLCRMSAPGYVRTVKLVLVK